MANDEALVEARGLIKEYGAGARVVNDVSFTIARGEALGLVGESGSGKSTVARLLLRLVEPSAGTVRLDGEDVLALDDAAQGAARDADDLPEPARRAQSSPHCICKHRRAAGDPGGPEGQGARGEGRGPHGGREPAAALHVALPARALGRAEAARVHRARAGAQ